MSGGTERPEVERLVIDRLGHHGDGIAAGAGGAVFVPLTLPGESVEGEVVGTRMATPRILSPSVERVRAPCPHYRACGGCLLQHATDSFVADWKMGVVRAALAAQKLEAPLLAIATSPPRTRRRASFAGRRTKASVLVGFHARASATLVAVPQCQVVHPDIIAALPALEEITRIGASRKGEVSLSVTRTSGGPDVVVRAGKDIDAALRADLAALAERHGLSRLTWGEEVVALRRPPVQRFGATGVVPPPGAFLQATADGEAALVAHVRKSVGGAARIADLFAGCGTFALPLAERAEVHAVEGAPAMVAALEQGWRRGTGLRRLTTEARDLFRRPLEPEELARFDAVVIDPPRAGAEAQSRAIAAARVPVVAAVSCNPATFARDAAILVGAGYRLESVHVVDQFRWSAHVELCARLTWPQKRPRVPRGASNLWPSHGVLG